MIEGLAHTRAFYAAIRDEFPCEGHCPECKPDLLPLSNGKTAEQHMGVRFGDSGYEVRLRIGEEEYDLGCFASEVFAGSNGWAYIYCLGDTQARYIFCPVCGDRACQRVIRGDIRIETARVSE